MLSEVQIGRDLPLGVSRCIVGELSLQQPAPKRVGRRRGYALEGGEPADPRQRLVVELHLRELTHDQPIAWPIAG